MRKDSSHGDLIAKKRYAWVGVIAYLIYRKFYMHFAWIYMKTYK